MGGLVCEGGGGGGGALCLCLYSPRYKTAEMASWSFTWNKTALVG